ncbi:GNVR domain-containing protein [Massilia cavernae]|uniref:GNVR domain-containing protein n=1 Tax=Massilia cavernae TaxID=2320864 RepID=UPI001E6090D9|nr:GNVR domain-containing protein [Massilia cavernae]
MAGLKNPNDLYVGMLRSRTVADALIAQFDLMKVYDTKSPELARKTLATNTIISSGKDGIISIDVEGEDRKMVAPMANAYVATLIKLTNELALTDASQRRMFFGRQLEDAKTKLANAETRLKGALDTHGVISVDSDSRAIVEMVGRVRGQISAKEIQLSSMQAFVTSNNPEHRRVREELNSLRAELGRLENGRPLASQPTTGGTKQVGLDNIKVLRDVKYYQMLYELLAKQFEMARLDEARESALVQVLDSAIEPELKVKPARAKMVVISALLAFLLTCGIALLIELKEKMLRVPEYAAQWARLKSILRFR